MRSCLTILALATVLSVPLPALSQARPAGGSILWLIPPTGRLEVEKAQNGTLSASDYFGPDDVYVDVWELQGQAGGSVTIDMKSDDFDTVLYVVGPGLAETLWDDDSGGRCDARVVLRFLENGIYRVAATTTGSRTTGVYTLTASASAPPASAAPCGGPDPATFAAMPLAGSITAGGEAVNGSLDGGDTALDDGAWAEAWEIAGEQGQTVTIRLESEAFDSFLYVTGPGLDSVLTDDDGGGDLHSLIQLTFPATGSFRIIASSVEARATGAYRLTVTR